MSPARVLVVVTAVIAMLLMACDESHSFTFENDGRTAAHVEWAVEKPSKADQLDHGLVTLEPGESQKTDLVIFFPGRNLRVRATFDSQVVERLYSFDQVKALDFIIRVTENPARQSQ